MIHSRRAMSLIELLVILSASTVLLTLTGQLLHRAMRIQIESRTHADVERNALRLSDQFRSDVHRAQAAVTNRDELGEGAFLQLQFVDDQSVEYSRIDGTVLRLLSSKDKPVSREEFEFPADSELAIVEEGAPPRIALTISAKSVEGPPTKDKPPLRALAIPVSLHVEASLGRDLRFATGPAAQEAPQ